MFATRAMRSFRQGGALFLSLAVFAAAVSLSGCGQMTATAHAAELAEKFKDSVDDFDKSRAKAAEQLSDDTKDAVKKLSSDSPDVEAASESWESAWAKFTPHIAELDTNLAAARKEAERYFAELDRNTESITNPATKASEKDKNGTIKQLWNQAHSEASQRITQLKAVQAQASDLQKVMLGEVLRGKIQSNIERIKGLASDAQDVLAKLDQLKTHSGTFVRAQ